MSAVATAVVGGAVISGYMSSNAAENAANTQAQAANNANATQLYMYNQSQNQLQPYMSAGNGATSRLADLLGTSGNYGASGYGSLTQPFDANTFNQYSDPSYQWQLQQGQQALQNSQAAQDGVLSGAALKDMQSYTQGMASTNYQNAFNNYQTQQGNIYQRLYGLSGLGQASAAGSAANAISAGSAMGANTVAAGNASAAGIIGSANAMSGGINNAAQYYMLKNMMTNTTPTSAS